MRRFWVVVGLIGVLLPFGVPGLPAAIPPRSNAAQAQAPAPVASYRMQVVLDPAAKTVAGSERISYRNPSEDTLDELYLRLYLKAFSNPETLWMREGGGQLRGDRMDPDAPGDIEVQSLRTADGADLLAGSTLSDTLLRVPLPAPLGPGQTIELDAEWSSKLPRVFARTGFGGRDDTFFMVGQWYPKMAVYDRGRWDTEPWHANSEFFNDFGDYDVSITVPDAYVVAGAGVPAGEQPGPNGTKTVRYVSETVTDYAFAASPDFLASSARSGDVEIAVYYLPEHAAAAPIYVDTAVRSLELFGAWYGAYPWPRLTVVDVPDNASGAGGMEYPTLVTGGLEGLPAGFGFVPYVTSHEIGHQWWPMQTATNEGREPWLDEGLTEYTGLRYMVETGTRIGLGDASIGAGSFERLSYAAGADMPLDLPAWQYDGSEYAIVYNKTALGLWTLEDVVGSERFRGAMAAYLQQFRFKHPTSEDFRASLEGSLGPLDWFFDDYVADGGAIEYAVERIQNDERQASVELSRGGQVRVPVDVLITFAGGTQRTEVWDGYAEAITYTYPAADPVADVQLDPEGKLHAETNLRDNQLSTQVQLAPAATLGGRLAFWAQMVVQLFGLFG